MAPIRKLDESPDDLRAERYTNLRKVRRKDYHDSGGSQRRFNELIDEFNTEEKRPGGERDADTDSVDLENSRTDRQGGKLDKLKAKASHRIKKLKTLDGEVGSKLDING